MKFPRAGQKNLLLLLPFFVAIAYMLFFSHLDTYSYDPMDSNDRTLFQRIANNILENGKFSGSISGDLVFCPVRPPLYPLIIALSWKITGSKTLLPIRIIQGIAYLLCIFFIYKIATLLTSGNKVYGILSSLFLSLFPHFSEVTQVILSESLAIFLLALCVLIAVSARGKIRYGSLIFLGIVLGMLTLQRSNFLLLPILFVVYLLYYSKLTVKSIFITTALLLISYTLTLTPWIVVNKIKTGHYSPTFSGIGFNLMLGIIEKNRPSWIQDIQKDYPNFIDNKAHENYLSEMKKFLRENIEVSTVSGHYSSDTQRLVNIAFLIYISAWNPTPPSTSEVVLADKFLRQIALQWIKQNPFLFMDIVLRNAIKMFYGENQPLIYHRIKSAEYTAINMAKTVFSMLFVMSVLALLRTRQYHLAFFPLSLVIYVFSTNSFMHTEPRYFLYAYLFMPLLIPSWALPIIQKWDKGTR